MRVLGFFIIGVFTVVFQTTILPMLPDLLGRPDLVFILVAFAAYRFDWLRGIFLAFACGWMMDVVAVSHLGLFVFEYLLVFGCLHTLVMTSPMKESTYQVPLVGISYMLGQFILYLSLGLVVSGSFMEWSWDRVFRETVVMMIASIPCFLLFNAFFEYFQNRKPASRFVRRKSGNRFR